MIDNFLTLFEQAFGNNYSLLVFLTISFLVKGYLFIYLTIKGIINSSKIYRPVPLLLLVLLSGIIQDSAWIARLIGRIFFASSQPSLYVAGWVIFSWAFPTIQYQAVALFLESLVNQQRHFSGRNILTSLISVGFSIFFVAAGILNLLDIRSLDMHIVQEFCSLYCILFLMPLSIINVFLKMKKSTVPEILRQQLLIILKFFIYPQLFCDFIQLYPFKIVSNSTLANSYGMVGLSTILLACAMYYCTRRIIALRFLNIKEHVEAADRFNFVNSFKDVLEQFSSVTNVKELAYITQTFFKENFNIPLSKIQVHIRNDGKKEGSLSSRPELSTIEVVAETFVTTHYQNIAAKTEEVLIFDEIAFNSFYGTKDQRQELHFLETINADIFLPIFKNDSVIAYIIVERYARPKEFYSTGERDEMVIFAHYLGNMIHLLKSRQLESIIQQEKELKEEIYNKHQEINQYRESIRSFLRNKPKEIGILFYKNRKFIFGNQTAQELVKVNPNTQEGHPFVKAIKQIATMVEEYKSPQNTIYAESPDQKYVISGVPNIEKNNVIITIYPPDISDIIKRQFSSLKDPSKWDYLLYLETTQSGQLINQMIPGNSETILHFKIDLLKLALNKKAILIDMPQEDTLSIVEILHHISLRETLHVMHIKSPSSHAEHAIKLFGINPIFSMNKDTQSLLEKLHNVGTLFIENIHLLELETQEYLAEYLQYGMFRVYKSDQRKEANVRIICSSNQDLTYLSQQGKFSANLLAELKKTQIKFPSLHELPQEELSELTEGFSHGMLQNQAYSSLLELTDREKNRLIESRPVSFKELKQRIQQLMHNKSKKNEIEHETHFDPAFVDISNPELLQAVRLGKHALRDKRVMTMLWNKFKNQNKIASFLGVNRSSVNRRCKEFNLE